MLANKYVTFRLNTSLAMNLVLFTAGEYAWQSCDKKNKHIVATFINFVDHVLQITKSRVITTIK